MLVSMISIKILGKLLILPLFLISIFGSCDDATSPEDLDDSWESITVTASAYNSSASQGSGNPKITAWGDTLQPHVQSIAVSRDLINKGLEYNTPVKIEGLDGIFIVNDKMHTRWQNKIDIYMGNNRTRALKWGRKKVVISFPNVKEADSLETD